jgi:hypothetical protein
MTEGSAVYVCTSGIASRSSLLHSLGSSRKSIIVLQFQLLCCYSNNEYFILLFSCTYILFSLFRCSLKPTQSQKTVLGTKHMKNLFLKTLSARSTYAYYLHDWAVRHPVKTYVGAPTLLRIKSNIRFNN